MVPRSPPRASRTPPSLNFQWFLVNLRCLVLVVFVALWICSFVLACQRLKENKPTKQQQLPKTGVQNWPKIMKKWRPGGSRRLLGEILGPFWSQGSPGDEKEPKTDLEDPPPRDPVGKQILTFCRFCGAFSRCFFECRFGMSSGPILSGFGEFFKEIFEYFFIIFRCEAKAVKCHSTLVFTVV